MRLNASAFIEVFAIQAQRLASWMRRFQVTLTSITINHFLQTRCLMFQCLAFFSGRESLLPG